MTPTIQRLGKSYTVTRRSAGSWVEGKFVGASPQTFTIIAVVVPAGVQQLQMLPEGQRESDTVRVFTDTEIHTADPVENKTADTINYRDRDYEIVRDSFWNGRFYEALAVRK